MSVKLVLPGVGSFDLQYATQRLGIFDYLKLYTKIITTSWGYVWVISYYTKAVKKVVVAKGWLWSMVISKVILSIQPTTITEYRLESYQKVRETPLSTACMYHVPHGSKFYFVHSYAALDSQDCSYHGYCDNVHFSAMATSGNAIGTQFHPEKAVQLASLF